MDSTTQLIGAQVIVSALKSLGVKVIFGIVGVPIGEIAEDAINNGIRYIGFRNEQAASYAANAYGYLTGKPGVCLVVGGPGVWHALAGVANANANAFPMILLAGSNETHLVTKGAFQELDAVSLLSPHTKRAVRPPNLELIPSLIQDAYRNSWYGRPGTSFVDFPADLIQEKVQSFDIVKQKVKVLSPPKSAVDEAKISQVARLIRAAKAPLVIIGKGVAYARAEIVVRKLIEQTNLPFLPSPMGKGVVPDSHPSNATSARSTALKNADVVLVLCARLNWMFHFGEAPKWNPEARIIQVDISPDEIGKNAGDPELGIVGDISTVIPQLLEHLRNWQFATESSDFVKQLVIAREKNEARAAMAAKKITVPLSYGHAYEIIKRTLDSFSPPKEGGIVYIAEGANTMDISRASFPLEHPRLRLDAGTYGTMGVGLAYAIAAFEAYNSTEEASSGATKRKKIVALEGDSAFGFSAMEFETMARYRMDILVFVINNGGIYQGSSDSAEEWLAMQTNSVNGEGGKGALRSSTLGWEVGYEKIAEACGGLGYLVRTSEELAKATEDGFKAQVPVIVNVIIESGKNSIPNFGWQSSAKKPTKSTSPSKL